MSHAKLLVALVFNGKGDSYEEWFERLKITLSAGELLHTLLDDSSKSSLSTKELDAYHIACRQAECIIKTSLPSECFRAVMKINHPTEIIKVLDEMFLTKTHSEKCYYIAKLINFKMNNDCDLEKHYNNYVKLVADASAHGINQMDLKIDELLIMLYLKSEI